MIAPIAKPKVDLYINGALVTSEMAPEGLDFTYQDFHHGQADEIAATLLDPTGKWRGAWRPEHGDIVQASIGYTNGPAMSCGTFEVDEPEASGSRSAGDTLTFRAIAAAPSKELRSKKNEAFEEQSLKQIVNKIAGRHGLSVVGEIDDITFKRVNKRRERDLEFLTRLAEDYGHFFTVKGDQLVFAKREQIESQGPVLTVANERPLLDYSLRDSTHKTYSTAKAQYLDPDTKELIEAQVEDNSVKTGDRLNIDDRTENKGQAEKLAKSRLAKANEAKRSGSLTFVGNPMLVAGQVIELNEDFGKWAGRYLIKTARHAINRSRGYTTALEINGLE